jgi:DNA-binding CsgD family transcriptional regulator
MQQDQLKTPKISRTSGVDLQDYVQLILEIMSFCQTLCKQSHNIGERLAREVMHSTHGRVRLSLPFQSSLNGRRFSFPVSASFPVQFCNRIYGSLEVASDPAYPASPALPLAVAQLLAHTCGMILYNLELSAFIEGQSQRLDFQSPGHLTRREREVLDLICRGYDQQTIAMKLNIADATVETYQKRIREKFGIHSERDIALAAYQSNLFSIID